MFNRLTDGGICHEIRKSHHPETGKGSVKTVKTMSDLLGKNGAIKKLVKHLTIAAVTGRADSHLGYERYQKKGHHGSNSRSGSSTKHLR